MEYYLAGFLSRREMHMIERHLLECDFCKEAMEGFEESRVDIGQDVKELREKLDDRAGIKRVAAQPLPKKATYPYFRIAAVIVLLVASVYFILNLPDSATESTVAVQQAQEKDAEPEGTASSPKLDEEEAREEFVEEEVAVATPPAESTSEPDVTDQPQVAALQESEPVEVIAEELDDTEELITEDAGFADQDLTSAGVIEDSIAVQDEDDLSEGGALIVADVSVTEPETLDELQEITSADQASDEDLVLSAPAREESISLAQSATRQKRRAGEERAAQGFAQPSATAPAEEEQISRTDPIPPAGLEQYLSDLQDKLNYPAEALAGGIEGEVIISFTVGLDGSLFNYEVVQSLGSGCDEEAIRLLRESGPWQPALVNGNPVGGTAQVGVQFKIEN